MDVKGKVAIITGASAGIGEATARCLAQAGTKVVLVARSADKLKTLAEELRRQGYEAWNFPTDMRDQQAVIPKMRMGGGGLIINVSSMVSKMRLPGLGTYAATKAALNLLSDTARVELAGENIRIITMYPRMTATDFGKHALGDQRMRQTQRSQGAREGVVVDQPEEVAQRILHAAQTEPEEQYMDK